ncbi:MAG: YesL family protein [Erysipelotrichaceae bacterium]
MFKIDGLLYRSLDRLSDFLLLNVCFIIGCLPLVTIGASLSALFSVTMKMVEFQDQKLVASFWEAYRANFKQATLLWAFVVAVGGVTCLNILLLANSDNYFISVYFVFMVVMLVFLGIFALYIFPLQARFANSTVNLMKNALMMSLVHLDKTLIMLACLFAIGFISMMSNLIFAWSIFVYVTVGFAMIAYLLSQYFVLIFNRYRQGEPA